MPPLGERVCYPGLAPRLGRRFHGEPGRRDADLRDPAVAELEPGMNGDGAQDGDATYQRQ